MTEFYPRVLLINGESFGRHSATAITLSNLFQGWSRDHIALVYCDGDTRDPGFGICERLWRISLADVPIDRTVRRLLGKRKDQLLGKAPSGMPSGLGTSVAGKRASIHTRLHGISSAWADLLPIRPEPAFWKWVDEFHPQVIYSMLGNIRLTNLVLRVANRYGTPIVPHFMDDWPTTHYRGMSTYIPRRMMLSKLRSTIRRSPMGMTIGPAMAEEYERRFGIPFEGFMNCVEVPEYCSAESAGDTDRPIRFLYVGGLHLNRWDALRNIGKTLSVLRDEGCRVELVIHAPVADIDRYSEVLSAIPTIRLGESLSQDQVFPAMRAADVLVHVESFEPTVREYTRLSLSTKVPQYMASGKPILAYGPGEVASCAYIRDCQCGLVVGQQHANLLLEAIRSLATDSQRRFLLGRRGWQVASAEHRGDKVRQRFRSVLTRVTTRTDRSASSESALQPPS